ncbi:MAG: hypothetical protein LIO96_06950, partial [Lachnospiraceae bacterium]|nr:hypothetical protein [Lachnospiraceae bacterium]
DRDRDLIRRRWPEMSFKEKCRYIWSYYRWYIVVGVVLLAFAVFFVRDIVSQDAEEAFYVMVLDGDLDTEDIADLKELLSAELEIDTEEYELVIETAYSDQNSTMQTEATVATYMQSGRVDLLLAPEDRFNTYAATGYLQALTADGYEELLEGVAEECLFWAEQVDYSSGGAVTEIPANPHEQTDESECYGIYLTNDFLEGMVAGIMVNAPHGEQAADGMRVFLEY